jgi:hypothetical protein
MHLRLGRIDGIRKIQCRSTVAAVHLKGKRVRPYSYHAMVEVVVEEVTTKQNTTKLVSRPSMCRPLTVFLESNSIPFNNVRYVPIQSHLHRPAWP